MERIAVDPERIRDRILNKDKSKKMGIDDLRETEIEDTILDRIRNRGKMTMEDLMTMDYYRSMIEERKHKGNDEKINIEEIIEKATKPFREEIRELKAQQEKEKEERKWDETNRRIEKLMDMMANLKNKGEEDRNPMLEEVKSLKQSIEDQRAKAEKVEREKFEEGIYSAIDNLNSRIADLRPEYEKSKSKDTLQELIDLEQKKKALIKAFGLKTDDEDASAADLISTGADLFTNKVPGIAKTIATVREAFKGGEDLPDDVPALENEDIPTTLPTRGAGERNNRSAVPQDIQEFLDRGKDTPEGFMDLAGVVWSSKIDNKPLMRSNIEALAITNPEIVREQMAEAYADAKKTEVKKTEVKKYTPKPMEPEIDEEPDELEPEDDENGDDVPEAPVEKPASPQNESDEASGSAENMEKTASPLDEAMEYINSGREIQGVNGKIMWVGPHDEAYSDEKGEYVDRAGMVSEAKADPVGFLESVKKTVGKL